MKIRKVLTGFMAFSLAISMSVGLIGCGKTTDQGNAELANTTATAVTDSTATAEKVDEPVELVVRHWFWTAKDQEKIIAEFNKKYPNIKLDYEFAEYEQYISKLKITLASGNGPDVFGLQPGALVDSSKTYLTQVEKFAEAEWGADWKGKFLDGSLDVATVKDLGIVGLPVDVSYAGMLYLNMDKVKSAGMEVPKTYEDLKKLSEAMISKGDLPVLVGAKDTWICLDLFGVIADDIAPGLFNKADLGEVKWTDPDMLKAFQIWDNLSKDKIIQNGAAGIPQYPNASDMFWKQGKGVALFDGDWAAGTFIMSDEEYKTGANKYEIKAIPFPDINGDGKTSPVLSTIGTILCINNAASDDKKDAAWDLVKWMVSEDYIPFMLTDIGQSMKPVFKDVEMTYTSDSENFKQASQDIKDMSSNIGGSREMTNLNAKKVLGEVLQEITVGLDPTKAAEKVQQAADTK